MLYRSRPLYPRDFNILCNGQVNAAASLNGTELDEIARTFALEPRLRAQTHLKETLSPTGGMAIDKRGGRSLLVRPPQLPVEDPMALREWDEEDISQLEAFLIKVQRAVCAACGKLKRALETQPHHGGIASTTQAEFAAGWNHFFTLAVHGRRVHRYDYVDSHGQLTNFPLILHGVFLLYASVFTSNS